MPLDQEDILVSLNIGVRHTKCQRKNLCVDYKALLVKIDTAVNTTLELNGFCLVIT